MAKYSKKIVNDICTLIGSDSYTIAEICKQVGITKDTYHRWINEKTDFSDSVKKARGEFDVMIAEEAKKSLLKKVKGYSVEETRTSYVDKNGKPKIKEKVTTTKYFQPDTASIIFTLTNKDPENWKNRQNIDAGLHMNGFDSLMQKVAERKKN
nr:phBC6A51 family helix-turn-helix protein [uncultured Draconibacterium sp.]